ncbi:MAG TPA: O-methyltransferase [Gemmatimonadaceae bacterium]|nr:O-methyltransferase [Gemmatimonadaceae bacterium]
MDDALGAYIGELFAREDDLLLSLREEADRSGLPPIAITPQAGRLLQVLLAAVGARRVLEVGTLGGYSAIWMARALPPDGRLISLEIDARHAEFARRYIARAGLAGRVEVWVGRAVDLLPALDGERFDLVFLDADKEPLPTYLEWALRLTRPGGLIVADNAFLHGRVADASDGEARTLAVREFNRRLASDPRVTATLIPVGDGLAVGVVKGKG